MALTVKQDGEKAGNTYKFIYNQFLPGTDYRLTKPYNFERNSERIPRSLLQGMRAN